MYKLLKCCKRILGCIASIVGVIIVGPYLCFVIVLYFMNDKSKKYGGYINNIVDEKYGDMIYSIVVIISIIPLTILFFLGMIYMFIRDDIVYKLILGKSYWVG